jgi:hypothetical protein
MEEGVYYFGGRLPNGAATNSVKILKIGKKVPEWITPETKGASPPARYDHTIKYYNELNFLILFGGRNDNNYYFKQATCFNDIWILPLRKLAFHNAYR